MPITELQRAKTLLSFYGKMDNMDLDILNENGELTIVFTKQTILTDNYIRERLSSFRIENGREPSYIMCNDFTYREMLNVYLSAYRIHESPSFIDGGYTIYGIPVVIHPDMENNTFNLST
jgi:hypothetical protein